MLMELPVARKQARIKGGGDSYHVHPQPNRPSFGIGDLISLNSLTSICILRYSP